MNKADSSRNFAPESGELTREERVRAIMRGIGSLLVLYPISRNSSSRASGRRIRIKELRKRNQAIREEVIKRNMIGVRAAVLDVNHTCGKVLSQIQDKKDADLIRKNLHKRSNIPIDVKRAINRKIEEVEKTVV